MSSTLKLSENRPSTYEGTRALLGLWWIIYGLAMLITDVRIGYWLAALTLLIAVPSIILPPRRVAGRFLYSPIAGLLLWVMVIGTVEYLLPPRCSPGIARRDAVPLILQLDAYRRRYGHYPASFEAAGIKSPLYRCGSFQYQRNTNGHCTLSIGKYALDLFTASWSSSTQEWTTDS